MLLKIKHFLKLKNLKKKLKLKLQQSFKFFVLLMKYKKEQGFYFVGTHCSPAQSQPTKPLYCLGGKQ